jgi:sialate O-acetylesterase
MAMSLSMAHADIRLPKVFSDHMVLQRDIPVPVWGWADPGERVTVTMAGQSVTVNADSTGKWQVKLSPLKPGVFCELVVAGKTITTVKDVLVGDVWICAGQSNMELGLEDSDNGKKVVPTAINPKIRILTVKPSHSPVPVRDIPAGWAVCSPQSAGRFSAVGYFFAAMIQNETGVPIGLIGNASGGALIESWMNMEGARAIQELAPICQGYEKKLADYRKELEALVEPAAKWAEESRLAKARNEPVPVPLLVWPVHPASSQAELTSLYNSRIAPLVPFGIKGVIWYQGESNARDWDSYYNKMRALIGGWRKVWGQGDFPFYFVQLPNYMNANKIPAGGDGWARLRMAQLKCLQIPRTGMAVTIDIGEAGNNHPVNKEDVGARLALWALKNDYGFTSRMCSGPLYKGMEVDGQRIRIGFDCADNGLMVGKKIGHGPAVEDPEGKLKRFAISGPDMKWFWADAVIDGSTVLVSSEFVHMPVAVRYAFSMNPAGCNLYNKEGLPASPFQTDN